MDILLGILIGIGYIVSLYVSYRWGHNERLKDKTSTQKQIDEETLKQMRLRQEGLQNIMNYNLDVAMNRGLSDE